MKIETQRILDTDKVREMCISHRYYTRGDCEAYERMFDKVRKANADNPEDVYAVALDIYEHSTLRPDECWTENELIAGIMYGLYNECGYTIVTIE